jgi:hypothetical protein
MTAADRTQITWRGSLWRVMLVLALALAAEQLFEDFAAVTLDRPADAAKAMGLEAGVIPGPSRPLTTITPGGAADRAGPRVGDAISSICSVISTFSRTAAFP